MSADLALQIWSRLRPDDRAWLVSLARLAGPDARVALVGGAVRDALLGSTPLDLDVVVEGVDVEALARATGLPMTFHPAFQNATVTLPDGRYADLVRARRETYPVAGQNPVPAPGTLEDDLRRRDFGLNALALIVSPTGPVAVLDVTGGLDDLHGRTLRSLHAKSLHEDASRVIRGVRLAARVGLTAHPELLAQVPDALEMADQTPRLWAELKLLLSEPRPGAVLQTLRAWGAGSLLPDTPLMDALDDLRGQGQTVTQQTYAAALLHASADPDALAARLEFGDRPAALLARACSDTFYPDGTPERQLRALLRPDAYVPLTGRDVLALGVPPGPAVGKALAHLAGLRHAGQVHSADDEQAELRSYLAGKRPQRGP